MLSPLYLAIILILKTILVSFSTDKFVIHVLITFPLSSLEIPTRSLYHHPKKAIFCSDSPPRNLVKTTRQPEIKKKQCQPTTGTRTTIT